MKINISKLSSWLIILFMPLSVYVAAGDKITIGDVGLIIAIVLSIYIVIKNKLRIKDIFCTEIIVYILFILINSSIQFLVNKQDFEDGIWSLFRYLLFMIAVAIIPKAVLKPEYTYKIYENLGTVFAIYAIMQFICFYLLRTILPIDILGIRTIADFSTIQDTSRYSNDLILFRPYSVFLEPSYFAIFETYILYWMLNCKKDKGNRDTIKIGIIAVSMLLAGTTGIIMAFIAFGKTIMRLFKKNFIKMMLVVLCVIIVIIIFYNTNYGNRIIRRIISDDGTLGSSAEGRLGNIEIVSEELNDIKTLLIGDGVWVEYQYLPTIGRLLVCYGVVGTLIFLYIMFNMYTKINKTGKQFFLLFIISWLATNSLFNITSVLVFSLLVMNYKEKGEKSEKSRISNMV